MESFLYALGPSENATTSYYVFFTAFGTYSILCDLIGITGFVLLLIYNCLKNKKRKGKEVQDYHGPIFNQLLYISAFIVLLQLISAIQRFLVLPFETKDTLSFLIYLLSSTFVFHYPTIIGCVLMFCFLAAFQRLIILYQPGYKNLVIGSALKFYIVPIWVASGHYAYLTMDEVFADPDCSLDKKKMILFYQGVLLTCTYSSAFSYYKIYKTLSQFTPATQPHKSIFLYQFLPIHTFLMTHTTSTLCCRVWNWLDTDCILFSCINEWLALFLFPMIPGLVSMSYIASRGSVRMMVVAILSPVWRAMRESAN